MASEIKYYGLATDTGKTTLTAQLYDSLGEATGAAITLAEVDSTFVFEGDMPAIGGGEYGVRIFEVTNYHLGRILTNTRRTNDSNGREELMDEDGSTVLMYGTMWEDSAGTVAYDVNSTGARRRNKMAP